MNKFEEIAEQFQAVDPPLRLELLLEYASKLPPLPNVYEPLRDAGLNMVHECQSPVFLLIDVKDGRVLIHADVPEEAPTARGFASILVHAFNGVLPDEVQQAPADILGYIGLRGLLGMQRTRGLSAIYQRLKNDVSRRSGAPSTARGQE